MQNSFGLRSISEPHKPLTAFFEILYGCNLRCTYCYVGEDRNHVEPIVPPLSTTVEILDSLKRGGIEEIILLGGEPTLHPHFSAICRAIADRLFTYRGIVSNGYGISTEVAGVLHDAGFWVDLTFRGADANTFDHLAGKAGAFAKAVEACKILSGQKVPVGIEFDCAKANYKQIFQAVADLVSMDVEIKQVQLHRVLPEGDALKHGIDGFILTLPEWSSVFEQAQQIYETFRIPVLLEDGFPLCLLEERYWRYVTPCACGFSLITVDPKGEVRACSCSSISYGNLLNEPLSSIWSNRLAGYRNLPGLPVACRACDLLERCRGGCTSSDRDPSMKLQDFFANQLHSIKTNDTQDRQPRYIQNQGVVVKG